MRASTQKAPRAFWKLLPIIYRAKMSLGEASKSKPVGPFGAKPARASAFISVLTLSDAEALAGFARTLGGAAPHSLGSAPPQAPPGVLRPRFMGVLPSRPLGVPRPRPSGGCSAHSLGAAAPQTLGRVLRPRPQGVHRPRPLGVLRPRNLRGSSAPGPRGCSIPGPHEGAPPHL